MGAQASVLATARASAVIRAEDLARARRFWGETLGLELRDIPGRPGEVQVLTGDDTLVCIYERPAMPAPANTTVCFEVPDVPAAVRELREHGVTFEEYDMPDMGLVTHDGVAHMGAEVRAWFKDSEGNAIVLRQRPL
jgi:predicted enzyme related to lactoylglutathione lyase